MGVMQSHKAFPKHSLLPDPLAPGRCLLKMLPLAVSVALLEGFGLEKDGSNPVVGMRL